MKIRLQQSVPNISLAESFDRLAKILDFGPGLLRAIIKNKYPFIEPYSKTKITRTSAEKLENLVHSWAPQDSKRGGVWGLINILDLLVGLKSSKIL